MKEVVFKYSWRKLLAQSILFSCIAFFLTYFFIHKPENMNEWGGNSDANQIVFILFMLSLIMVPSSLLSWVRLCCDKRFLKLTEEGFYYKDSPFREWYFFSWDDVYDIKFTEIYRAKSRTIRIEVNFYYPERLHKVAPIVHDSRRRYFLFYKPPADLLIPLYVLEKRKPRTIYKAMKYYYDQWQEGQRDSDIKESGEK